MSLRYRAVLFDLDGTLVDSYAALADAVNFALRQHGLGELSTDEIRKFVGDGLELLLHRAFVGHMPIDVEAAHNSGIDAAVVATGSSTSSALKAAHPDHYLDRLADLVEIFRNGASA